MPCAESTQNYEHKVNKDIIMLNKKEAVDQKRYN